MFRLILYLLTNLFTQISGVPPDYCNTPLNDADCKSNPVPVFSYYKPGSRCELYIWRGCPTVNKFEDQYECVNMCIFRMSRTDGGDKLSLYYDSPQYCLERLNTKYCDSNTQMVYTYDSVEKQCSWEIWNGCDTLNKFPDEDSCNRVCNGVTVESPDKHEKEKMHAWIQKVDKLDDKYVEEINNIIKEITEEENSDAEFSTLRHDSTSSPITKIMKKPNVTITKVVTVSDVKVKETTSEKNKSTQTKKKVEDVKVLSAGNSDKVDRDYYDNFDVEVFQKDNQELQRGTVADVIIPDQYSMV